LHKNISLEDLTGSKKDLTFLSKKQLFYNRLNSHL